MEKKSAYRFNIQLNPNDPLHMTVIRTLNAQGRRKSQFLVNAVLHYIMEDRAPEKAVTPDPEKIRSVCREIIGEMLAGIQPKAIPISEEDRGGDHPSEDDIDLGSIAEALDGFRKK